MDQAIQGLESPISRPMANFIPRSIHHSITLAKKNMEMGGQTKMDGDTLEILGNIYKTTTGDLGLLTDQARTSLELFHEGKYGIEVAHQPKFLGGERFVVNKLSLGAALSAQDPEFYPFFYLADYDKVHAELTKTHFPLVNSSTGFPLSVDQEDEKRFDGAGIRYLPLPPQEYTESLLNTLRENYLFSINTCVQEGYKGNLLEERLESAIRHLKRTLHASRSYGEWFLRIIGTITNIYLDHGYIFLISSNEDYRKILTPHYEYILQHRERYIQIYQEIQETFTNSGFSSPLRDIKEDFVPFFYECPEKSCHGHRIQLSATKAGSMIVLQGKCPACNMLHEIVTSRSHPDLADHVMQLTPRVESRQYLVSKTSIPAIHVSGTGETRYYTMSMPLMKRLDPDAMLPVIHFYNKVTTNTFITRYLEGRIINSGLNGFLDAIKELMKKVGKFNQLVRKYEDGTKMEKFLNETIGILKDMNEAMKELESTCQHHVESKENGKVLHDLDYYLANLFGQIAPERHGQESVFHWIDLCMKNGLSKVTRDYMHVYQPWLPPGLQVFL
ncbi:hypothetical protein GF325_17555 [Candidatus Bathyarchaeota archaeon]|nr:hypothetical protein [Candidatus Bathyarchaeota archaeon]